MKKVNLGVVGCGNISGIYFENLTNRFKNVTVYACADLIEENAKNACEKYGVPRIMTLDQMLKDAEIQLILNITTPPFHYEINKKCLLAGKSVYVEKPLALNFEEGKELVDIAREKGLFIGCAPDTFMGAGIQTCRKLIDDGYIGKVIGGNAFMLCHGHEHWHPNPSFYYKNGAGPMFDMGPYYLTALVNLLGAIKEIHSMTGKSFETRTITSKPQYGEVIDVEIDTHVCGLLHFENGAIVTITTSFDVWKHSMPNIELYGTEGSLRVPDPNTFGGNILLSTAGSDFKEVPYTHKFDQNSRGIGVSNIASCVLGDAKTHRANGDLALHVLEAMCALTSPNKKGIYKMHTKPPRPSGMERSDSAGCVK